MNFLTLKVYEKRHAAIRKLLKQEGYEAFIVLTPDNFLYLTGFFLDVAPWERPVALVIPKDGKPFAIMNELSTHHIMMSKERETFAVEEVHLWMEHPSSSIRNYVLLNWTKLLADQLKAHGIYKGTIATDSSYGSIANVKQALPKVSFVVETRWLVEMRTVKCKEELEIVRQCAVLADYAQEVWVDLVAPGKYVKVVDSLVVAEVIRKGAELYPGANIQVGNLGLSGPPSASPHGNSDSSIKFNVGDSIVNIFCPRLNGYVVENERSYVLGEPTALQAKAHRAATAACEAAAQQMVAGNVVSSIDAAAQAVYEAEGLAQYIRHRTGHGLGLAGHEFPHDVAFNHRLLQVGEVWSAEPGIYIYGVGGFRHDDTVIVGEKEPEVVTKSTKKLEDMILPIK